MPIHRLTSTDAFVVVDLPGTSSATGIVRCARKILTDGAELLARSVTYSAASFDAQISGASGGINAEGDARGAAIAAFAAEAPTLIPGLRLELTAGKGVHPDELAAPGSSESDAPGQDGGSGGSTRRHDLIAVGAVAAALTALGSLDGVTVAVEAVPGVTNAVLERLEGTGAVLTDGAVAPPEADVWFVGSKAGLIDHEVAANMTSRLIVPIGAVPITARGLAVARRNGVMVLPDFLSCAGPLLAGILAGSHDGPGPAPRAGTLDAHVSDRIGAAVARVLDHEHGPLLGACMMAEAFLTTWVDHLPFGRPLA